MTKITFSTVFPTVDQIAVLKDRPTKRRGWSMWYGVSQLVLNLPRILVIGLFVASVRIIVALLTFVCTTVFSLFIMTVLTPLMATLSTLILGFAGRLDLSSGEDAKDQTVESLLIMMDFNQSRKVEKGEKTAD